MMSKYDQLKKRNTEAFASASNEVRKLNVIASESRRVAEVAHHAGDIISDLDAQFSAKTQLSKTDITFLFLAAALQCTRQYVFSNEKFRIDNTQGDAMMSKIVPKQWQDILLQSVPYDAFFLTPEVKERYGSIGVSGKTHRYRTLGHDPLLGWVFGTMNILSDSLTKTDFTTYAVKIPYVTGMYPDGLAGAFRCATMQASYDKFNLPAAITRQAIHFGSDYFTKQGLPVPLITIVDNSLAQSMLTKWNIDMYSISRGASFSVLINAIIAFIHQLFYDEAVDGAASLYEVRTRKILSYSNAIASGSNIIYVALSQDLTKLDVGGMLVTLYRLLSDYKFMQSVKQEFLENEWYNIVIGEEYEF